MDPLFINKEKIASLLPMEECIEVMEKMFRSLAAGECLQPLRNIMRLQDGSGVLGMMPGYAGQLSVMGIKVITVFHANSEAGLPSHQGIVMLFDAKHGQPLMLFDALEITAIPFLSCVCEYGTVCTILFQPVFTTITFSTTIN